MATITNFGDENLPMLSVDVVMTHREKESDTAFFEIEFLEGVLKTRKLLIGEFVFSDTSDEVSYSATFEDETEDTNNELLADNIELIRNVVTAILTEAMEIDEGED